MSNPIQVFYGSGLIVPAPKLSITPEFFYANDNVIGYTYNIILDGFANSLRKELAFDNNSSFSGTLDHIKDIRNIFNFNGGDLTVTENGSGIMVAKGATIKNLSFNESNNKWVEYAPYSVELEFNEIDFIGCSDNDAINCASSLFHKNQPNIISDNLVDIKKYKLKEFNDKWTFTIEDDIYASYNNENHKAFKVSYNLSATGKNFYVNNQTIPAWQQAKLFCQDKLYTQVNKLIDSVAILSDNSITSSCDATLDISNIHRNVGISGLQNFDAHFSVYNETIKCDTSEANGSFSVTYNALIKYDDRGNANHTFTKNVQYSDDSSNETTISIEGNIQGLTKGGFIKYASKTDYDLPQQGEFIVPYSGISRYKNALNYLNNYVINNNDLHSDFKTLLDISHSGLGLKGSPSIVPQSLSTDHNYLTGEINYSVAYSAKHIRSRDIGFTNISITRKDPTEIIQEFVVPFRSSGPIIQKLGAYNPRTISINIDGAHSGNINCDYSSTNICELLPVIPTGILNLLQEEDSDWYKTRDNRSVNRIDGSYSFSLEYTCKGS